MKKIIFAVALAIASLGAAQAQTPVESQPPAEKQMHYLVGMGLTFGGDQLAKAHYKDGTNVNITAGGQVAFIAGIDYRVTPEFSLQSTIGYQMDSAGATNGHVTFSRIPLELLAYYHVSPQWRIGGGARYVTSAKLTSSGAGYIGNYEYKNTLTPVIEAEYLMSPKLGLKVRFVNETFERTDDGSKWDGKNIGFYGNFYF